jgi:hypothetical protein
MLLYGQICRDIYTSAYYAFKGAICCAIFSIVQYTPNHFTLVVSP